MSSDNMDDAIIEAVKKYGIAGAHDIFELSVEECKERVIKLTRDTVRKDKKKPVREKTGNILFIADLHFPAVHPGYVDFCLERARRHNCSIAVIGGDMIDNDYLKKYDPDLDYLNPSGEYAKTKVMVKDFLERLDGYDVKWVLGNHDTRLHAKAKRDKTPGWHLKTIKELYEIPDSVEIAEDKLIVNDIAVRHKGYGALHPHIGLRNAEMSNAVCFHAHSRSSLDAVKTSGGFFWCCVVGCGVDKSHPAIKYAAQHKSEQILSCLVVEGKQPFLYWMPENWR